MVKLDLSSGEDEKDEDLTKEFVMDEAPMEETTTQVVKQVWVGKTGSP